MKYGHKRSREFDDDEHRSEKRAEPLTSVNKTLPELLGELQQLWSLVATTSIMLTISTIADHIGVVDQVAEIPMILKKVQFLAEQSGLPIAK